MKKKYTDDLHCHLNGSVSLAFLRTIAEKNNCLHLYEELEKVNQQYLANTSQQPEQGYPTELLNLVWKQFALIHLIIQNPSDITNGVMDVVANSDANYLEIRTTPKPIGEATLLDYIEAFKRGLEEANQIFSATKKAVGLLSLDRTIHTAQDAQYFLEQIIASAPGVLVGLDISGNPLAKRTLTGEELIKTIELVLENNLSIAIHMGEADTQAEKRDTETVLNTLAAWKAKQPLKGINPFYGKVRLDHCIYLTTEQQQRIHDLGIPIEVCPTCHNKLNWHDKNQEHPIKKIYNDLSSQPIVFGTDDQFIFGASAKLEFSHGLTFFANSKQLTKQELKEHQAQFRFSSN